MEIASLKDGDKEKNDKNKEVLGSFLRHVKYLKLTQLSWKVASGKVRLFFVQTSKSALVDNVTDPQVEKKVSMNWIRGEVTNKV